MGFLDKIDKDKLSKLAKTAGEKTLEASKIVGEKAKDTSKVVGEKAKEASEKSKESSAKSKESKLPVEGAKIRYSIIYLGGISGLKSKCQEIGFNILEDSFYLKPTTISESWFEDLEIPYNDITKFEITTRTLSTAELMLTKDAKGIQTDNNIEISYKSGEQKNILRLEMLTGVTVAGQALKCKELTDFMRSEGIFDKLNIEENKPAVQQIIHQDDIVTQIKKLNDLKELGVISEEEFNTKKTELLSKM